MRPTFDARDAEIRATRLAAFDKLTGPRCGDYVHFACGTVRRVSHVWDIDPVGVQTSAGGSWYLGAGWTPDEAHVSFSGSLCRSVPLDSLTLTPETRDGLVWFFHHGFAERDNGVDTTIPFRVYTCNLPAPE